MLERITLPQLTNYFLLGRCVRTLAATLFTAAGVLGFANNFEALLATDFEVTSLFRLDIGLTLFRVGVPIRALDRLIENQYVLLVFRT